MGDADRLEEIRGLGEKRGDARDRRVRFAGRLTSGTDRDPSQTPRAPWEVGR
jgi:hypothetical protein